MLQNLRCQRDIEKKKEEDSLILLQKLKEVMTLKSDIKNLRIETKKNERDSQEIWAIINNQGL